MSHLLSITIINVDDNVSNLYVKRYLYTLTFSDYLKTRFKEYVYIISLQNIKNEKIELLKNDIYL